MLKKVLISVIVLILVAVGTLFAINGKSNYDSSKYSATATNGLKVGSKIEFKLPDQFNKPIELSNNTKQVIFVFAKKTGHTVREFLKKEPKSYLPSRNTIFVADVSGMPTVIRNTFALPDFRKSPYSVALIYDEKIAKVYKKGIDADKIIIVSLDNKVIRKVKMINGAKELKKALN